MFTMILMGVGFIIVAVVFKVLADRLPGRAGGRRGSRRDSGSVSADANRGERVAASGSNDEADDGEDWDGLDGPDFQGNAEVPAPYRARAKVMSPAEISFHGVLRMALDDVTKRMDRRVPPILLAKIRIADFVQVDGSITRGDRGLWSAARNRICCKHVDFLLCHPETFAPLLAIELDDSSHKLAKQVRRDEFVNRVYRAADLPVLHVPASRQYSVKELSQLLEAALSKGGSAA